MKSKYNFQNLNEFKTVAEHKDKLIHRITSKMSCPSYCDEVLTRQPCSWLRAVPQATVILTHVVTRWVPLSLKVPDTSVSINMSHASLAVCVKWETEESSLHIFFLL